MARGKYESRKHGTSSPLVEVNGGAGSPTAAGSQALPAANRSGAKPAGMPVLGVVVMSSWGWRILAVAAMMAVGLCVTFLLDGHTAIGGLWAFIALAWSFFTVRLWRMHLAWDLER